MECCTDWKVFHQVSLICCNSHISQEVTSAKKVLHGFACVALFHRRELPLAWGLCLHYLAPHKGRTGNATPPCSLTAVKLKWPEIGGFMRRLLI